MFGGRRERGAWSLSAAKLSWLCFPIMSQTRVVPGEELAPEKQSEPEWLAYTKPLPESHWKPLRRRPGSRPENQIKPWRNLKDLMKTNGLGFSDMLQISTKGCYTPLSSRKDTQLNVCITKAIILTLALSGFCELIFFCVQSKIMQASKVKLECSEKLRKKFISRFNSIWDIFDQNLIFCQGANY